MGALVGTPELARPFLAAALPQAVAYPLREHPVGHTMAALAVAGRTAEALACYGATRQALDEDLGQQPVCRAPAPAP